MRSSTDHRPPAGDPRAGARPTPPPVGPVRAPAVRQARAAGTRYNQINPEKLADLPSLLDDDRWPPRW
ncbi:hypothetical protein [Micromonospora sp. NPDC048898]|uniref:hypothetical protein n=1 Tax=Micromonospora sp. NPDC048898 TaxID=3364260 RepID=UPI003718CA5E